MIETQSISYFHSIPSSIDHILEMEMT